MSATIIAVCGQKGGCGKTTLAMLLAGSFGRLGLRVLVVDADVQGTATQYAAAAPEDAPFPAAVSGLAAAGDKIHREIKKHLESYDLIVIDCPPSIDAVTPQSALLVADLALLPVLPSPADLWAAQGSRALIERVRVINEDLQAHIVVNGVQANSRLTQAALGELQDFPLPPLTTKIALRTAYRQAMALGVPVQALGSDAKAAIAEIDALVMEVIALLPALSMFLPKKNTKKSVKQPNVKKDKAHAA